MLSLEYFALEYMRVSGDRTQVDGEHEKEWVLYRPTN